MHFDNFPPQMVVALVGTVSWAIVMVVLGLPFVRAWARRMERRNEQGLPPERQR
jgi:hypothetical protein